MAPMLPRERLRHVLQDVREMSLDRTAGFLFSAALVDGRAKKLPGE
jgi:hypothetical protein